MTEKKSSGRLGMIDSFRGLLVIEMIVYHALYDIFVIFGVDDMFPFYTPVRIWERSIASSFILISGFVWPFGKRRAFLRGLEVLAASVAVTLVTLIFLPDEKILFGILFLIGISMWLLIPLDKVFSRIPPSVGFIVSLVFFWCTYNIESGYITAPFLGDITLPGRLYSFFAGAAFGFPPESFSSSDYFPVVPWFFMYLTGYFLSKLLLEDDKKRGERARGMMSHENSFLSFAGRHSLVIYLLHQVVIFGALSVIFAFI